MTTKQINKLKTTNNVRSSSLPPLYAIQYPNCRTGMFSLRPPFKDSYRNERQQPMYTRSLTPNVVHPEYLHVDQRNQYERSFQRDAQVQCSLTTPPTPLSRDGIAIRRPPYIRDTLSPHYRVQLQLQPAQPNIYEVWDVETPPPRTIPINEPIRYRERTIRTRSPRLVNIKSFSDDDESDDYDDTILYARYPRRTYLPSNVRMVCVRHDANTISY